MLSAFCIKLWYFFRHIHREVFFVDEPVLMVPILYVNIPTCLLRVLDNDTGEELTRVFQKVAPSNLKKNKVSLASVPLANCIKFRIFNLALSIASLYFKRKESAA